MSRIWLTRAELELIYPKETTDPKEAEPTMEKPKYDPLASAQVHVAAHNSALPGPLKPAGRHRVVDEDEAALIRAQFERERDQRKTDAADRRARKRARRLAAAHHELDMLGVPRAQADDESVLLTLDERRALL